MNNRDYKEWLKYKKMRFRSFFLRWVLRISTGISIGRVLMSIYYDHYQLPLSSENYIDLFFVFVAQWLISALILSIFSPLYWKYGMRKLSKYRM